MKDRSVGRVGQPGGPFAGMVWNGHSWVGLGENEIAERPAIPDPIAAPPRPPGWYRIPGIAHRGHYWKALYWDGHTLAQHTEWIPHGVGLPVATADMRASHLPTTHAFVGTAGHRGWAARGAWWSLGVVSVIFGLSLVAGTVAGDPVMGGDWGGAVAPVLQGVWLASCAGFVVPFVLALLAVSTGHNSAWAPLLLSAGVLSILGFFFVLALAATL